MRGLITDKVLSRERFHKKISGIIKTIPSAKCVLNRISCTKMTEFGCVQKIFLVYYSLDGPAPSMLQMRICTQYNFHIGLLQVKNILLTSIMYETHIKKRRRSPHYPNEFAKKL